MSSQAASQGDRAQACLLHIDVMIKDRLVKRYAFSKDLITIGRDPEADIFLDNPGVSRNHAKLERVPAGYMLEDLGSANGSFLKGEPVHRHLLKDDDVVNIAKFSLVFSEREDRRGLHPTASGAEAIVGTTVLSRDQLERVLAAAREKNAEHEASPSEASPASPPPPIPMRPEARRSAGLRFRSPVIAAFASGVVLGAAATWLVLAVFE